MTAANTRGDRSAVQRAMKAILADSSRNQEPRNEQPPLPGMERPTAFAGGAQTQRMPRAAGATVRSLTTALPDHVADLIYETPAHRRLSDLVLAQPLMHELEEFLYEYSNASLLRKHSLEPRHKILLVGPPGNGKTSLAEVLATELGLPFLTVRYDAIVDSYLGETSSRVRKLIDFATHTPCLLFFDEFETVGKERSDSQETGEIKRVVSSLLMQIDRLPSHALVVCATNHPEMLDRAIWRRFELQLEVPPPGAKELKVWFERFQSSFQDQSIGLAMDSFIATMEGRSMSEVENFTLNVRRKLILSRGTLDAAEAVREVLQGLKNRLSTTTTRKRERAKRKSNNSVESGGQGGEAV